ncbi:MAG: hypothetical protein JO360_05700 [Acidobacteria bacterium]|nr:hypothetical protein [Acidobacteriota bacterium]
MEMFTVYIDESYGTADAYSVAGYVATESQWEELAREWREFAQQEGFTILHKRCLEHFQDEFKWEGLSQKEKEAKRLRINQRACKIILRRVNAGFSASVKKSDWLAMDKTEIAKTLGTGLYAAGVMSCMKLVVAWAQDFNKQGDIDYVFESGANGATEVTRLLQEISSVEPLRQFYRLGSWGFARKKPIDDNLNSAVIPLQTADLLAYETYRHVDNKLLDSNKLNKYGKAFPMRGALACLLQQDDRLSSTDNNPIVKPTPHYMVYMHQENLQELSKILTKHFQNEESP